MGIALTSRRRLLRALAATPIATIPAPFTDILISEWQAAIQAWRKAEADLVPIRNRFDTAETHWFAAKTDPFAIAEHEQANRDYESQLERCDAALNVLLSTRAPSLAAVVRKLGIVVNRLRPDMPAELYFLSTDLRAFEAEEDRHALL